MKRNSSFFIIFSLCMLCITSGTAGARDPGPAADGNLQGLRLNTQGEECHVEYRTMDGQLLRLSEGLPGKHLAPELHRRGTQAWVIWEIVSFGRSGIGMYNLNDHRRNTFFPAGVRDMGQIEPDWGPGDAPAGFFYIAKDHQVDLFHYDVLSGRPVRLTVDGKVEHGFSVSGSNAAVDIVVEYKDSRWALRLRRPDMKRIAEPVIMDSDVIPERSRIKEDEKAGKLFFMAYGDSITWGKMYLPEMDANRMQWTDLAYPHLLQDRLQALGYLAEHVVQGHPGEDTRFGREHVDQFLDEAPFTSLIVLFGTNDVWLVHSVMIEAAVENMEYIVDAGLDRGLDVLVCTVPPRNDQYDNSLTRSRCEEFNRGIRLLSEKKPFSLVDVYDAFWNFDPPEGWKTLLEPAEYIPGVVDSGCHPNPDGHALMADLMQESFKSSASLPEAPQGIAVQELSDLNGFAVSWRENEGMFEEYVLEFGFQPDTFIQSIELRDPYFFFIYRQLAGIGFSGKGYTLLRNGSGMIQGILLHEPSDVFFHLKGLTPDGRESDWSETFTVEGYENELKKSRPAPNIVR